MNKSLRLIVGVLVIVIGVGMLFNNQSSSSTRLDESDSINLKGIEKIIVKGSSEEIRILASSDNNLKAELSGKTSGFSLNKPELQIKKSGSTVTLEVKRSWFQIFTSSQLELDIYIDEDYNHDLSLDISSGSLDVEDRFDVNNLDIDISSGNMTLEAINSKEATINISSGNLKINEFTGDIDGTISSGDVVIEYITFDNDIDFEASSGSVDIFLPKNADFELKGHRSSGSIKTDFDLSDYSNSDNNIEGIAGSGNNKIDLEISSGSIFIGEK